MAVLLIRHGETALNAARVVQFPDTPLGDHGKMQAEQLALKLRQRSIKLVLTSDYMRARMTAERVVEHTGVTLIESPNLRERNFGDHRGSSYEGLGSLDIFAPGYHPPGGESWETFHARVDLAWGEVTAHARALSGDLAVVTHGLVLRSLFERMLDLSNHVIEPDLIVHNTSVTVVEPAPPWRVIELAGVDHLEDGSRNGAPV